MVVPFFLLTSLPKIRMSAVPLDEAFDEISSLADQGEKHRIHVRVQTERKTQIMENL